MSDEAGSAAAGPDPHVLGPGLLPTPFTADEIRAASGAGKTIGLVVELPSGERFERVNRFVDCDAEGATLEQWRLDAAGDVDGDVASGRVTWRDLQEHAAFPAEHTTRSGVTLELVLGGEAVALDCLRYEVRHGVGDDVQVTRFWFALAYPGMPVRYEVPTPTGLARTTVTAIDVTPPAVG
ncbi:hypothetical protein SAMN05428970_0020 [Agromyces sp. CF514]|uniref:hypothetical protein n=1 Tax=Agromyces sp. CF514 TaxID=1881031 RepID=UPI0008F1324C|nr:hypothetical protein [Agromyces sp. CF514]SFR66348.1 hypothetical protein SAMN05428970_0020 [Agromyces sp. CF514]